MMVKKNDIRLHSITHTFCHNFKRQYCEDVRRVNAPIPNKNKTNINES